MKFINYITFDMNKRMKVKKKEKKIMESVEKSYIINLNCSCEETNSDVHSYRTIIISLVENVSSLVKFAVFQNFKEKNL